MKRYFRLATIGFISLLACACIITASPKETDVRVQAGESLTFKIGIFPACVDILWYLDGELTGDSGTSFTYSPKQDDFGYHEISALEITDWGKDLRVWSVAVSYIGWGEEQLIGSGGSVNPQIVCDPLGNAVAVWRQFDGTAYSIYADRYVAETGWGIKEPVESGAGDADDPQITCDSLGNVFVVWSQYDGTYYSIYANRYVAGTGWGPEEIIESGAGDALHPQIACDDEGNALALWKQYNGTAYSIYANRCTTGSGWGIEEPVESGVGDADNPQIICDTWGNALAVWNQYDGFSDSICANRYVYDSGWGEEEIIDASQRNAYYPQIACDAGGNAIAVWQQDDGSGYPSPNYCICANRYIFSSGWGEARLIETESGLRISDEHPQITCDAQGNALAVWHQLNYNAHQIRSNRYIAGYGWGPEENIISYLESADYPQIAGDAAGNAIAVWNRYDGDVHRIYACRYTPDSGWGEEEPIESDEGDTRDPQVACDETGNAIVVWEQMDLGIRNIYAIRYGLQLP